MQQVPSAANSSHPIHRLLSYLLSSGASLASSDAMEVWLHHEVRAGLRHLLLSLRLSHTKGTIAHKHLFPPSALLSFLSLVVISCFLLSLPVCLPYLYFLSLSHCPTIADSTCPCRSVFDPTDLTFTARRCSFARVTTYAATSTDDVPSSSVAETSRPQSRFWQSIFAIHADACMATIPRLSGLTKAIHLLDPLPTQPGFDLFR